MTAAAPVIAGKRVGKSPPGTRRRPGPGTPDADTSPDRSPSITTQSIALAAEGTDRDRSVTAHEGGCCDRDECPTCGRSFSDGVGWLEVHTPGQHHRAPLIGRCCITKPEYISWREVGL